jgi:hypothetical protein
MKMTVVFPDGSRFIGDRKWWFHYRESKGTHHFIVESSNYPEFKELSKRKEKVAVPLTSAKFFVLH